MNTASQPTPSLRARVRSAQWMHRTEGGKHEDALDRAARAEFQSEAAALPETVREALAKAEGQS